MVRSGIGRNFALVGDQKDGHAPLLVDAAEDLHDLVAGGGIQGAGGFVGQDEGRVAHQGAGDGHPLLLATR